MSDEIVRDERGEPILDRFSKDGFVDCTFRIAAIDRAGDTYDLLLSASHRGVRVGCRVIVQQGLRAGFDAEMGLIAEHIYRPAVQFIRSGPESDALVTALAGLYEMDEGTRRMIERRRFTGIVLANGPIDMETDHVRIKLFGCDSEEEVERGEYFESFFNLNLADGYVLWNEKDFDYRVPLLRGMTAPVT